MDAVKHPPEMEELLSLYALGALDGDDLRAVEEHLAAGCPECRAELARLAAEIEGLAASLPPVSPAEITRARLLAQLPPAEARQISNAGGRTRGAKRSGWLASLAVAAMLLLVCGWGWLAARREADALRSGQGGLSRRVAALAGQLAAAQSRAEGLARDLSSQQPERERLARELSAAQTQSARLARDLQAAAARSERLATAMAIISAPGMRPIALAALKAPPGAAGHTFVDPVSRKAVFVAANLPQLAADKTYELWFIADGKPVAAGTFGVDSSGRSGTLEVNGVAPLDRIQAWAVTVEPRGGVPQPTGTMVLKG
jgi:anti-sigma-K factor RskA